MDFAMSDRAVDLKAKLVEFDDDIVRPAEAVYREQRAASGDPHFPPPVMEELKVEARKRDLWNLFLPEPEHGPGLSNLEYAPLCEVMGTSALLGEATNCSAPDTGNMEILEQFGTPLQQEQWLRPLLDGEIRSCFAMTEPWVASSAATNISSSIERDGDDYVINGHKWFTSGARDLMCMRAQTRVAFKKPLADQGVVQANIAESRMQIEQVRLLTMKAAWMMDTVGKKNARTEIAAIKVVAARVATDVIDRAIQLFGGAGVTDDWPLATMYAHARTLHLVDGPDDVHLRQIARNELGKYAQLRPAGF